MDQVSPRVILKGITHYFTWIEQFFGNCELFLGQYLSSPPTC